MGPILFGPAITGLILCLCIYLMARGHSLHNKAVKLIALGSWVLLAVPLTVHAQCAAGIPGAGNPGCIPPSQPTSPYDQPGSENSIALSPAATWEDRWGQLRSTRRQECLEQLLAVNPKS